MSRRTFSDDIVFVNKTSANFGTRSRREAYQINSHINGSYARWKRKEGALQLRSKSTKSTPGSDERITDSRRTAQEVNSEQCQLDTSPSCAAAAADSTNVRTSSLSQPEMPPTGTQLQLSNSQSVLCRGNSDPFDSTVLPMTALNAHCHRLAREFQVGNIWGEEMSNYDLRTATLNWWLADTTTTTAATVMHGLLAWAYTISLAALEHKTATLRGLQGLMQALISFENRYAAFECMLFLAATEWTAGNVEALMTHMRTAAAILRTMGGFEVLPKPKKESSLWMFVNLCFHFPIRPLVRPQEFDPGSLASQKILLKKVPELRRGLRPATFRRVTGTAISVLAGSTLITLWEAMSEAQRAVELIRHNLTLSSAKFASVNRWLFLRKLTTRVRLEHLWHDTKLLHDDNITQEPISNGTCLSQSHLYLWQLCTCMATRIFDGLIFDKLHPGEDLTGHWTPFFVRYLLHLSMLEDEEDKCDQPTEQSSPMFHQQCQLTMLWLYFMGATVEGLIFHQTGGLPASANASVEQGYSCTRRFKALYQRSIFEDENDVARMFEEKLLFSSDMMQDMLDELVQNTGTCVESVLVTKTPH